MIAYFARLEMHGGSISSDQVMSWKTNLLPVELVSKERTLYRAASWCGSLAPTSSAYAKACSCRQKTLAGRVQTKRFREGIDCGIEKIKIKKE